MGLKEGAGLRLSSGGDPENKGENQVKGGKKRGFRPTPPTGVVPTVIMFCRRWHHRMSVPPAGKVVNLLMFPATSQSAVCPALTQD